MMNRVLRGFGSAPVFRCLYCFTRIPNTTTGQPITHCPSCNYRLPTGFFNGPSKIIAITGGTECGKTIFMTVLAKVLREKTPLIKRGKALSIRIPNKGEKTQQERREKTLYENRATLPATISGDPDLRLVIQMLANAGQKANESLFLSFRDMPGGDMRDVDTITANEQILNADGLLYVLDPLNISAIYDSLKLRPGYENLDPPTIDAVDEISNLYDTLVGAKGLINQKVDIPVAFCVSKMDLLHDLAHIKLPEDLNKENSEDALNDIEDICSDFYEKLRELSENHQSASLITAIEAQFSNFKFFPMSSLGLVNKDMAAPYLTAPPEPVGVVHPLYWILKKVKFI